MNLPRQFGRYLLLRRLAVGGMAEIYVAKTRGLGGFEKLVALKLVHPHLSADPHFIQMLIDEAKILVMLSHANIAQVFDLGETEGTYYIAMEFVEGLDVHGLQTTSKKLTRDLPIAACCYIASEALNGLDYAHRKRDSNGQPLNLVHRDISPQNVVISRAGEVKLVDFGIAKTSLHGGDGTEVGVIKGKYYYMSPEQAWADPMDRRSDIFSTGIVIHEMLTGRMVYSAQSIPELISRVRNAEIAPPERLRPDVPPALSKIVMKALARDPDKRFESALGMAEALREFLYGFEPSFNAGRLARFVTDLLESEAQVELASAGKAVADGLARLKRGEFVLDEDSVIAALPDGATVHATRNEVLPLRLRRHSNAEQAAASGPPASTAEPLAAPIRTERIRMEEEAADWSDAGSPDAGADEPTQLWQGLERKADDDGEPTIVDSGLVQHYQDALGLAKPGTSAAPQPVGADLGRTDSGSPSPFAHYLPPPSDWPSQNLGAAPVALQNLATLGAAEDQAGVRPFPGATSGARAAEGRPSVEARTDGRGDKPALVPPPGIVATVDRIPPSPPLPDLGGNGLFQTGRYRGFPWLPVSFGVILMLIGAVSYHLARSARAVPTLDILSVPPGASVHVDGKPQSGLTPLTIEALETGRDYALHITLDGYLPWDGTYRAAPGPLRHIAVLKPIAGELRIRSIPTGAQVWLDDVAIGHTPLTVSSLPVGRHVRLRAKYGTSPEMTREVTLRAGEASPTVTFEFKVPWSPKP